MSVLYDDVQMEQLTARNTKVLIFMRSLDIYDSINKPSGLWFILTQLSIGRNEYGKSGRLCIFTSLKHFNGAFEVKIFRASFLYIIKDTDSMQGHIQLRFFFKWKHC